jgi:hypothetical protein
LNKTNEDKQGQNRTSRTKGKEKKTREKWKKGPEKGKREEKKVCFKRAPASSKGKQNKLASRFNWLLGCAQVYLCPMLSRRCPFEYFCISKLVMYIGRWV